MKYRLRRVSRIYIWVLVLMILSLSLFTGSFYMLKTSDEPVIINHKKNYDNTIKKEVKKHNSIIKFMNSLSNIVYDIDIDHKVTSILIYDNNRYFSYLFDYITGKEIGIADIIKSGELNNFYNKVNELLYLKYPKFIADVLSKNDKTNVYSFKENELIIYYYDYEINPQINELLSLTVNYNEISELLNLTVTLDSEYQNEDGYVIKDTDKLIAITFDDGPSGYTKPLVDILKNNKAKSTFFMVTNKLNKNKDTVLYVHNNGNEIGYHSYEHKNFKRQKIEDIQNEYKWSNELLKSIIGSEFNLTRPPYGAINNEVKESINTAFILWSLDTEDWRNRDVDYLKKYVLDNVKEGDIILFHDMYSTTIEAVEQLLPELYVLGYRFVTVTDLAKNYNKTLEPNIVYRYFIR